MKKFGVLLCVMLCVPMFAFKANNEAADYSDCSV